MAEENMVFIFQEEPYFKQMLEIYGDKACMKLAYIDLNNINLLKQRAIELEEKVTEIKQSLKVNANSKRQNKISPIKSTTREP